MKQRIQKVLASAGVAARRHIEQLVVEGHVAVNGVVQTELPVMIDPEVDEIEIDGEPVTLATRRVEQRHYYIAHKPKGVICTNASQPGRLRAVDLLPPDLRARLFPVGRLDVESTGLLLLTNDGELTNKLTHPKFGIAKTYRVQVDGYITGETLEKIRRGVWLSDEKRGPRAKGIKARAEHTRIVKRTRHASQIDLILKEGRNRQVRRMFAKVGHKVRELTRIRLGPLSLGDLPRGSVRKLSQQEVAKLYKAVQPPDEGGSPRGGSTQRAGAARAAKRDGPKKRSERK